MVGHLLCAFAGIVVALGFYWLTRVRPLERDLARERYERESERRAAKTQLAAVAAEQIRVRGWSPQASNVPTVKP